MLGDGLALLAIPLLVLRVTSSPTVAVLASLPGSVGYLAAGIPAGVLADRLDPWLVLGGGDVLRALIFLALFLLTGSPAVPVWLILALAFAAGAVTVFSDTALAIAVRDVFAGPGLVPANSWLESASQGGPDHRAGRGRAAGGGRAAARLDADRRAHVPGLAGHAGRRPPPVRRPPRAQARRRPGGRWAGTWPRASGTWPRPGCWPRC